MIESKKKNLKGLLLDPSFFRIVYFITLFASGLAFIDVFAYVLNIVNLIWAAFISVNLVLNKKIQNVRYYIILILFFAVTIIAALFHINIAFYKDYNLVFMYNFVFSFHAFICFFILYGMHTENSKEKIKREMFLICKIILLLTTIFTIVGFIITLVKNEIIVDFPFPNFPQMLKDVAEPEYVLGVVAKDSGTRFEGIFTNPNIAAFYCSVSLIFCHILFVSKEFFKIKSKVLLYVVLAACVLTNFIGLILSDSYASFIFLTVYVVCCLFYKIVISSESLSGKTYVVKSLSFILIGAFLILSLFATRMYFQNGASDMISDFSAFTSTDLDFNENEPDIKFGRPNHDLSKGSGRRVLLKQAYIIFKNNPIIGTGPANLIFYGEKYFDSGLIFSNFHNGYVSILISYGVIGFTLFAIFIILVFWQLLKFLLKSKKSYDKVYPLLFSALVSYLVFALFEKTMLSENNFMCAFFWIILGYASTYVFNVKSLILNSKEKK